MPRLILLAAVALTVYILIRRAQAQPPHKRRAAYLQLLFGGAAIVAVILTLAGKMHWLGAALTGAVVMLRQSLPLLIRAFPLLSQWLQNRQAKAAGQQSEVRTQFLKMTLDHASGELNGEVIDGPWKDWFLSEMPREQLEELMRFLEANDDDSAQLLASYLAQRFPGGDGEFGAEDAQRATPPESGMTRSEALAVLGLNDEASEDDIVKAHRSLMQKLHPDRGGNDYLAAKINEAKDFLLGR
ncbi:MAG: DnaJ domain-containing protein [Halieaceae bacterium]|nr:DnaJ domain-containing protein [Halieaceae bacterium]